MTLPEEVLARALAIDALKDAQNALKDYIETIERTGASLNYGHAVQRKIKVALKALTGSP